MSNTPSSPVFPRTVSDDEASDSDGGLEYMSMDEDESEFFDAFDKEDEELDEEGGDDDEGEEEDIQTTPPVSKACYQERIPFHSRLGYRLDFIQLKAPDKKSHLQKTFAYQLFGERLVMYKLDLTKNQGNLPERYQEPNGYCYEILCSKFEKKREQNIPKKTMTLFYVLIEGPGYPKIGLQEELDKVANWGALPSPKVASRLELLFSTAVNVTKSKGKDGVGIYTDLSSDDFEMIPEDSNVGCGFIPRSYLSRLLGTTVAGARTFAIQVRIFSTEYGVFKGMLMEKPGINKIQLPTSMQKIGPSLTSARNRQASILINNFYPSSVHLNVAKLLDGEKDPPPSFKPKKLTWMITNLLTSLGVTEESMDEYVQESHLPPGKALQHASVVGVADPTNALPPGHVFVTGILGTDADLPELFVTRFPCTQPRDGLMLPVVSCKPDNMTTEHWNFLCNLPFGAIVFGNALPEEPSMPSICSNGDLDGDNYFVCWNTKLLEQIQPVEPAEGEYDDGVMEQWPVNNDWLKDVQGPLANASRLAMIFELLGKLCIACKNLVESCGTECPEVKALGLAYKDSLEVAKHGKKVRLPAYMWEILPESLHSLLVNVPSCRCEHSNDPQRHNTTQKKARQHRAKNSGGKSNTSQDENIDLQGLKEGDLLDIIGGAHKAKKATFVRLTPKKVRVKLLGSTKDTCLSRNNVCPARE